LGVVIMTPAEALLADLRSRGIELAADAEGRVRWRPAFMVRAFEADLIRAHRAALAALLAGPDTPPRCKSCCWPLDAERRCPKCFDRECVDCGRATGSYFIKRCIPCGNALPEDKC
jgi:hypothetical protein